jgi:adenylosuccinate lyase
VIPRYSLPAMASLWTDEARFSAWLEVEILAVEAWAGLGVVPPEHAAEIRQKTLGMVSAADVAAIAARERVTDHDVAAFVDVAAERVGEPAGAWVHYGLTSSDVVDTALSLTLSRAAELLERAAEGLEQAIATRARELRDTPMAGRTHGIHAEPTTMGAKLALWALQVRRDRQRLARAHEAVAVGKLSGAVGTYSNVDPRVEAEICRRLGLRPVPATQVLARDRHAEFVYACASVGASVESFALEVRHLQRTEVGEAAEPFRTGAQKGSSAMPHKRNPVRCEQLCGLARVLRANVVPALEDIALWHERDISHSSVERVILPDSALLAYYLMVKFTEVIAGLEVYPERMLENLDRSYGLVFSQPVLLALVASGLPRDVAYRITQRAAMTAWGERRPFLDVLREDPEVTSRLPEERLAACFDLKGALANAGRVFDALDAEEGVS